MYEEIYVFFNEIVVFGSLEMKLDFLNMFIYFMVIFLLVVIKSSCLVVSYLVGICKLY